MVRQVWMFRRGYDHGAGPPQAAVRDRPAASCWRRGPLACPISRTALGPSSRHAYVCPRIQGCIGGRLARGRKALLGFGQSRGPDQRFSAATVGETDFAVIVYREEDQ